MNHTKKINQHSKFHKKKENEKSKVTNNKSKGTPTQKLTTEQGKGKKEGN